MPVASLAGPVSGESNGPSHRIGHRRVDTKYIGRAHDRSEICGLIHVDQDLIGIEASNRDAVLIPRARFIQTRVVANVVEETPRGLCCGAERSVIGIEVRLLKDLFEVGLCDRDRLTLKHRVDAAPGRCVDDQHGSRERDRDHDDRHDEFDEADAGLTSCAI